MDSDERKRQHLVHTKLGNIEKVKQLLEEDKKNHKYYRLYAIYTITFCRVGYK